MPRGADLDPHPAIDSPVFDEVPVLQQPVDGIAIRAATLDDAGAIATIYNHFVRDTIITFEEIEIDGDEIARRMQSVWSSSLPWLVAEEHAQIVGYSYATKWKERVGYRFSVESTVYLTPGATGKGIGLALYNALIVLLEKAGVHAVMGGIALPNDASVALHAKMAMKQVAHFEQTGFKFGRWIDVVYYERLFAA